MLADHNFNSSTDNAKQPNEDDEDDDCRDQNSGERTTLQEQHQVVTFTFGEK